MDRLKVKARTARNKVAESASRGTGSGSLSAPHSTLPPEDNASMVGVNEGFVGPQPGTAARDFAAPADQPAQQPAIEPPTSLQSSVDAGTVVPIPRKHGRRSKATSSSTAFGRARSNSAPNAPLPPPPPPPTQQSRPAATRQSSIGIRRMPSSTALRSVALNPNTSTNALSQSASRLPALEEEVQLEPTATNSTSTSDSSAPRAEPSRLRKVSSAVQTRLGFWKDKGKEQDVEAGADTIPAPQMDQGWQYSSNMVDVLDTVDPEVQTLTSLTNIQNSLFIPNLGRFVNRRPTYNLQRAPSESASLEDINRILSRAQGTQEEPGPRLTRSGTQGTVATLATIDSRMSDSRYAVLPHGTSLEGWSKEDKQELNDHVRHMLHSKRSKFKRSMRGFGKYVRRPLGFLVTLYAFLITIFGLAWVLFLIGWINVGGQQIYVIHIIDSIMVALFAVVGDGLAPFRAVDTYHMIFIAHYHHYTWSRRKKDMLPELKDHNDLPSRNAPMAGRNFSDEDPEKQWEFTVLTPKQQARLEHHQSKFSNSHSFYKPHETETHHAFPLRFLIAIVVLLDCHSLLQISLGATTWGIYYKHRHPAITTVILCCSITVNAVAGLLITIGDRRTRKKDVVERMNRQELTEEAMQHIEKKKERESESEREDGSSSKKGSRRSLNLIRHTNSASSGQQGTKPAESAYP
ncbi:hypothetical protein K458DRAFT_300387 [Lentithecium fluviatile CBS 122367]|uniref:Integral membrane protein n=1 Tax=Lentithecium fluviatile CBS 122367 TaxID=1168545 RepID=A0A6G1J646_9PLEO|nr:hypothetical protein K458DRAFT_300387 [Lentithecium fluviatile CBS 122367]